MRRSGVWVVAYIPKHILKRNARVGIKPSAGFPQAASTDSAPQLADKVYGLLSTYPNLRWIAPGLEIADLAARFRALHRLKTNALPTLAPPDALQAATAAHVRATGLITNDPVFERVELFETLVLERLL